VSNIKKPTAPNRKPALQEQPLDARYRNSLGKDLHYLSRELERALMLETAASGYQGLKMNWDSVFINLDYQNGSRVVDLAAINGLTKQAMSQVVADIEAHGYVTKQDDPTDGRAKKVVLTPKGKKMVRDSIEAQNRVVARYEALVGEKKISELKRVLADVVQALQQHEAKD
jgi:DNA-binding MarR family transcriptional regulator